MQAALGRLVARARRRAPPVAGMGAEDGADARAAAVERLLRARVSPIRAEPWLLAAQLQRAVLERRGVSAAASATRAVAVWEGRYAGARDAAAPALYFLLRLSRHAPDRLRRGPGPAAAAAAPPPWAHAAPEMPPPEMPRPAPPEVPRPAGAPSASHAAAAAADPLSAALPWMADVCALLRGADGVDLRWDRAGGGAVVADPRSAAAALPPAVLALLRRVCETGALARRARAALAAGRPAHDGVVAAAFRLAVRERLALLDELVARMEAAPAAQASLHTALAWTLPLRATLRWLADAAEAVRGLRGGALLSALHARAAHGDPDVRAAAMHVLGRAARPLLRMAAEWIWSGAHADPHAEFFVAEAENKDARGSLADREFAGRFVLEPARVPSFFSHELADTVLRLGRSVRFLADACGELYYVSGCRPEHLLELDFGDGADVSSRLLAALLPVAARMDRHVLDVLYEKFALRAHFEVVHRYVLLGRAEFAQFLLDGLAHELDQPLPAVHHYVVAAALSRALRESWSDPREHVAIRRVDVTLAAAALVRDGAGASASAAAACGWDAFAVVFRPEGPLRSVFSDAVLADYTACFGAMWRVARARHALDRAWAARRGARVAAARADWRAAPRPRLALHRVAVALRVVEAHMHASVREVQWVRLAHALGDMQHLNGLLELHAAHLEALRWGLFVEPRADAARDALLRLVDAAVRLSTSADEGAAIAALKALSNLRDELLAAPTGAPVSWRWLGDLLPQ